MKKCALNDCCGPKWVAPCCFDCPERDRCPDCCPKVDRQSPDRTFCASMIEEDKN